MPLKTLVVDDDKEVLELMYRDSLAGPAIYRPGQFWQHYEDQHYKGLMENSLRNLGEIGSAIGGGLVAEEPFPTFFEWGGSQLFQGNKDNPGFKSLVETLNNLIKNCPDDPFLPYVLSLNSLRRAAARYSDYYGATRNARPLRDISWPQLGTPGDVFEYEGNTFTYRTLYYYTKYAFAARHIDFDKVDVIVELGGGSGRPAAMLADLYPHITYLMFDIPTSLYFSHQFMRAALGDRIISYEQSRAMTTLQSLERGKIYHFGSWQFPLLRGFHADLLWNCQSLQEMEADAVTNYTSIIEEFADAAFIVHAINGVQSGPAGSLSLRAPGARAADYGVKYLPSFDVIESSLAYDVLGDDVGAGGIQDMFLKRRASSNPALERF